MRKLILFLFGLFVCSSVMAQEVMVVGYPSGRPVSMTETISSLSGWEITGSITTETTLDVVIGGELTVQGTGDTEIAGDVIVDGTLQASAANILGVDEVMSFSDGNSIDGNKTPGYITIDDLMVTSSDTTLGNAFRVQNSALATKFTVLSNGNVGVGTTAPGAEMVISADNTMPNLVIKAVSAVSQAPQLRLQRGTNSDIYTDWAIANVSGNIEVRASVSGGADTEYARFTTSGATLGGTMTTINGTFVSSNATTLGWVKKTAANTACTTTCTYAAVLGQDSTSKDIVQADDATADVCICAGGN